MAPVGSATEAQQTLEQALQTQISEMTRRQTHRKCIFSYKNIQVQPFKNMPGLCKSSPSPPLFALPDCFYLYWAIVTALNATPQRRGKKRRQNVCKAIFQCLRKSIVPPILQHSSLHLAGLQQMEPDGTQVRKTGLSQCCKVAQGCPCQKSEAALAEP